MSICQARLPLSIKNKKKKCHRQTAVKRVAARHATLSCWWRPDLRLEHPQRIGVEGGSIEHLCHVIIVREEADSIEHLCHVVIVGEEADGSGSGI
jgi:hypothetical protein